MSQRKFLRVENADNTIEYWEGDTKIAFINDSGNLQATRGNADQKEDLIPWIREKYPNDLPEDDGHSINSETESAPEITEKPEHFDPESVADENFLGALQEIEKATPDIVLNRVNLPIICPIVGSNQLGDKDPEVVNWWRQNHPEEFKRRYSGRRIQTDSGIIV